MKWEVKKIELTNLLGQTVGMKKDSLTNLLTYQSGKNVYGVHICLS